MLRRSIYSKERKYKMSEHQPVWKRAEDNGKHRIAASPKQIKTQIAKISYTSTIKTPINKNKPKVYPLKEDDSTSDSKKIIKPIELETRKICTNDNTSIEFVKMKEQCDQEIKNLNTYLSEIINNSADKSKLTENDKVECEAENIAKKRNKLFRRCTTEVDFRPVLQSERRLKTRVGSIIRSKSSHPPDTKSHELLPSAAQDVKRKSYNVEEARKFLKDQKRRRRIQQATSALKVKGEKNVIEKEQIKKRLEELRRNSRTIITKNVNKKKKSLIALDDRERKEIKVNLDLLKQIYVKENNCGEAIKDIKIDPVIKKSEAVTAEFCPSTTNDNVVKNVETEDKSKCNSNRKSIILDPIKETVKLKFPEKRIGLLRKPETENYSFSAIREFNFDKENIALEMLAPECIQSVPITLSNDKDNAKYREDIPLEVTYRKPTCVLLQYSQADELKNCEISKENEVDSIIKSCDEIHSKCEVNTDNITVNNLPYWLKPSAVQIYPYNFIMAVRRKLEALADVRQAINQIDIKSQKTVNTHIADKISLSRVDCFNQSLKQQPHAAESKYYSGESLKIFKTDTEQKYTNCSNSNIHPTQSQSEINSNLSSTSIQLLQSSNNVSRTSSNKTNSIPLTYAKSKAFALASEDDTTVSSSIFNSPERIIRQKNDTSKSKWEELHGAISPLSLERVENLTIMSSNKLKTAIAAKHVNPNRGDSQTSSIMEQNFSHKKSTPSEIDFNQLLSDFNRSLSQVIEVNDRLKTTINKSHEMCGTTHTENRNIRGPDDYTTDFDKLSSHRTNNNSSGVHNENDLRHAHIEYYSEKQNWELKYGGKQTSKQPKKIIKASEEPQLQLDDQLDKIKKSKRKCISSQKYGLSKVCHESTEICSLHVKHNMLEIENSEHAEHLTETLISTRISEESECEHTSNIQANTRSKTENENKQNVKTLKKSKFLLERKNPFTTMKHEDRPYQQNVLSQNITASHKILEMFDHSNLEISLGSANSSSLSDSNCSYSNVGMYEKLIRNETNKSEHLAALLKIREKALFDRTKGQIAWLEVQKERCKSKGLLLQIAAIKKKQRGILLKMEKEREEIKRLLQSTTSTSSTELTSNLETKAFVPSSRKPDKSVVPQKTNTKIYQRITKSDREKKSPTSQSTSVSSIYNKAPGLSQQNIKVKVDRPEPVVRANYTLETSRSLEELLQKRELDLQRRREHVERLMQWHRRLDQEEAEVLQMEKKLLSYNTRKSESKHLPATKTKELPQDQAVTVPVNKYNTHVRVQRRLKEIKNSLKELNSISRTHTTAGSNERSGEEIVVDAIDCVRTTGTKLNKLWRRLTAQQFEKYEPDKHYELSKADLENLYEAAKVAVLKDFSNNEGHFAADLLEKSIFSCEPNILPSQQLSQQQNQLESVLVPSLKLCTSSESSDKEGESWEDTSVNSLQRDNYSPSTAAEKFQHIYARNSGSETLSSIVTQSSSEVNILLPKITSSMKTTISSIGLVRSLSDSVLYSKDRLPQDGKQEAVNICKEQCTALNQKCSSALTESTSKQVLESNISLPISANASNQTHGNSISAMKHIFSPTALNYKSVYMEEKMGAQKNIFNISDNKAANDDLKVSSKNEVLSCFQQDLVCVSPETTTTEYQVSNDNNNSNSICTNLDSTQNDNNNSCSIFVNLDSIKSQPLSEEDSFNSKIFISQPKIFESDEATNANCISKPYDDDFESSGELTQIDDLSMPHVESIVDVQLTGSENVDLNYGVKDNMEKDIRILSSLSEKPRNSQFNQSNSEIITVIPPPQTSADNVRLPAQDANGSPASSSIQLMPDIINELEIRRCQQLLIEPEKVKQFDNASTVLPYMYVREIPNKPPPPYVPPAHGSPMTTIFPSEERIKEISYRRTHELYCELLKTDYITEAGKKLPTVMDEKITNIYERIILDICREYLDEHSEVLTQGDPDNFHTQLAFFNPPNRLHCIQESIYKEVRRCLNMDKTLKRRTPIYSVYGQRANRDHIGKIIIQEMYEEDDKWCNFHREENEVVDLIISEMVGKCLNTIAKEVIIEENGT